MYVQKTTNELFSVDAKLLVRFKTCGIRGDNTVTFLQTFSHLNLTYRAISKGHLNALGKPAIVNNFVNRTLALALSEKRSIHVQGIVEFGYSYLAVHAEIGSCVIRQISVKFHVNPNVSRDHG